MDEYHRSGQIQSGDYGSAIINNTGFDCIIFKKYYPTFQSALREDTFKNEFTSLVRIHKGRVNSFARVWHLNLWKSGNFELTIESEMSGIQ